MSRYERLVNGSFVRRFNKDGGVEEMIYDPQKLLDPFIEELNKPKHVATERRFDPRPVIALLALVLSGLAVYYGYEITTQQGRHESVPLAGTRIPISPQSSATPFP